MDLREVTALMAEGAVIEESVLREAEDRCWEMLKDLRDSGIQAAAAAMELKIAKIQGYKPFKKKKGPRSKKEIQNSIDYCVQMREQFIMTRRPAEAAKWAYKISEFEKEYEEALLGREYTPEIE